jgi:hypothetical protein
MVLELPHLHRLWPPLEKNQVKLNDFDVTTNLHPNKSPKMNGSDRCGKGDLWAPHQRDVEMEG